MTEGSHGDHGGNRSRAIKLLVSAGIAKEQGSLFRGRLDVVEPIAIAGWAINRKRPLVPVHMELIVANRVVSRVVVDRNRADISAFLGVRIEAGFVFGQGDIADATEAAAHAGTDTFDLRIEGTDYYLAIDHPLPSIIAQVLPEAISRVSATPAVPPKIIAFYLPQYHPIPENDAWWGKGFTEWINVSQAAPLFKGHYQPHIPADMGYYDLRIPEVRKAQTDLARRFGIYGFCYYYYWFDGRKLLDLPLAAVLSSGEPDFPFCICWANETWSRRWDGAESEVLIQQQHSRESDAAFITEVLPILRDSRYIKIGGAPLLIVYRASLLSEPVETCERWRAICAENGIPDIHLCCAETFGLTEPEKYGFDSSVEFPPHNTRLPDIAHQVRGLDPGFQGSLFDYVEAVAEDLAAEPPPYTRFKGVMLGWDNTARRGRHGTIFANASPAAYEVWLNGAIDFTRQHLPDDKQFLFVNAWNEWAEGTHLEPDQKYGTAYLEATERALVGRSSLTTLTEVLRMSHAPVPAAVASFLDRCSAELAVRDRTIAYLRQIVHERPQPYAISRLLPADPDRMQKWSVDQAASACIDLFGPRPFRGIARASRRGLHYLVGWVVFPETIADERTPFWLIAENAGDPRLCFKALIESRIRRADVADVHAQMAVLASLWSGFACYVDWHAATSGEYQIRLATASARKPSMTGNLGTICLE